MCLRWRQLSKYPGNKSIRIQRFPVACDPPEASASTSLRGEVRKVTVGECCLVGFDNAGGSGSSLWGCWLHYVPFKLVTAAPRQPQAIASWRSGREWAGALRCSV
jgi:hypothetical protein